MRELEMQLGQIADDIASLSKRLALVEHCLSEVGLDTDPAGEGPIASPLELSQKINALCNYLGIKLTKN